jgi:hypothetical protein
MKLKERLVMVTLGFSIAIVLFLFQEYFFVDSIPFSSPSFPDEKITGNRFHGQINVKSKKKTLNNEDAAAPVNFKQRNLQKTGSGSNAASGISGNGVKHNGY